MLKRATEQDKSDMAKHMHFDERSVIRKLETLSTTKLKIYYLQHRYPSIAIFVMKKADMKNALAEYTAKCKSFENDWANYSYYVHGYFIQWLQ